MFFEIINNNYNLFIYFLYSIIVLIIFTFIQLIFSEQLRKNVFAFIYTCEWTGNWPKQFYPYKKIFFKQFTQLKPKKTNEKLTVLEVGPGGGTNFDFYPENCKLIALDYNENFKNNFMKKITNHPNIELMKYLNGCMEDMSQVEDDSVDVVITTNVLCSVKDEVKAIREVKRVLKKGGKYFFMEHMGFEVTRDISDKMWSLIQNLLNPIWSLTGGGCQLQRKSWNHLKRAGFERTQITVSYPDNVPRLVRPQMWGFVQK